MAVEACIESIGGAVVCFHFCIKKSRWKRIEKTNHDASFLLVSIGTIGDYEWLELRAKSLLKS